MVTVTDDGAQFRYASDQSLLIYFGHQIALQANENVRKLLRLLELEPVAEIRNLHPAYCSVLVKFDAIRIGHAELEAILREYLDRLEEVALPEPRQVEIPVCYGGEDGPDLGNGAASPGMTPHQPCALPLSPNLLGYFF